MTITLCHIDDIPEGGSRGFAVGDTRLFAVKKRNEIFLYLNRCPHLGIALEWEPDNFLDTEGLYIRCSNHGAFFEIDTGNCIQGPCLGDGLWALDYRLEDGMVIIEEEELPESPVPA
jgi:nitrite reductase/ring-hydroxylating ferredoxin subunit